MSNKLKVTAEVHRLSDSSDEEEIQASQEAKRSNIPDSNLEKEQDTLSNSDIIKLLLQQNQNLIKIVEKG